MTPKGTFYLDWSRRIPGSLVGRNRLIVSRSEHIWRFLFFDRTAYKGLYVLWDVTQPLFKDFALFGWIYALSKQYTPHPVAQPADEPRSTWWVLAKIAPEAAFQSLMEDVPLEDLIRPIELADVLSREHVFDTRHTMRMVDLSLGRFVAGDLAGALEAARAGLEVRQLYDYETPWRERAQWIVDKLEARHVDQLQEYLQTLEEQARAVLRNL